MSMKPVLGRIRFVKVKDDDREEVLVFKNDKLRYYLITKGELVVPQK